MKSYVFFKIKGLNQERFFNRAAKQAAIFCIVRKTRNEANFKVKLADAEMIEKFATENNLEILEKKEKGLFFNTLKLFKNWGVTAAIIFSACVGIVLSNFVLKVEILGNESITNQQISEVMDMGNAGIFSNKHRIDEKKLELLLMEKLPRLSFVSVLIKGQTLIINVKERLYPDELETEFKPLTAAYDGEIIEINLVSGTPVVKAGDIVKAGDLLVLPYTTDSSGKELKVIAKAEITAKVWLVGEAVHYDLETVKTKTGKLVEITTLNLFGLDLQKIGETPSFTDYIVEEKTFYLSDFLPIKVKKQIFYEATTEIKETAFSEVSQAKEAQARSKALQNFLEYEIIEEEYSTLTSEAGKNIVTYVVVVHRRIDVNHT